MTVGGLAHILHDGFTDMFYVFFPVWQAQFALSFTQVGLLKMLLSGAMALFQVPAGIVSRRLGASKVLVFGTFLTSLAVFMLGWSNAAIALGIFLFLCGVGSSVQHPLASAMISDVCCEPGERRTVLSTYNFCGDIGKFIFPGLAALLLAHMEWPQGLQLMSILGFVATVTIFLLVGGHRAQLTVATGKKTSIGFGTALQDLIGNRSFIALWLIGVLDSATRMGFLTFFPFLLRDKGADVTIIGFALTILFAGGATGKLVCGLLATRLGALRTVIVTEIVTTACVVSMITLPLSAALWLSPLLGVALNGTSSVLYGSVPELVSDSMRSTAFAMFYTGTIGSSALSPLLFGMLGDKIGLESALLWVAVMALFTLPLTWPMRGKLC